MPTRTWDVIGLEQGSRDVLFVSHRLKMIRAAAGRIPAQMVDLHSRRNGSDVVFVDDAVNEEHHLRTVSATESNVQSTIALSSNGASRPRPASILRADDPGEDPLAPCLDPIVAWLVAGHEMDDTHRPKEA